MRFWTTFWLVLAGLVFVVAFYAAVKYAIAIILVAVVVAGLVWAARTVCGK